MISSLHHPSFTVENLDRSIAFYRDLLGIPLEGVWERDPDYSENITGIKGAQVKVAYFRLPNASFELVEYMSAPEKRSTPPRTTWGRPCLFHCRRFRRLY